MSSRGAPFTVRGRAPGGRARYRIGQFARHVIPRDTRVVDAAICCRTTTAEWELVSRLSPSDRRHLLQVRLRLEAAGCVDPDLLSTALLHDIGKVDDRGRVRLAHRVAHVLLRRFAPGLLGVLARPGRSHGLYLAVEHPRVGAALAREAGCSDRVCWLIAHHHDPAAAGDPGMAMLRMADEED